MNQRRKTSGKAAIKIAGVKPTALKSPPMANQRDRLPLQNRISAWVQKCRENNRVGEESLVKEFLQRLDGLRAQYKSRQELARRLHVTGSTIAHWRTGHSLPGRDHAIALAVIDTELDAPLLERAKTWVRLCGLENDPNCKETPLKTAVDQATSLPGQIERALDGLKSAAKLKGIPEHDFGMALSCFLGHTRLEADISQWLGQSDGKGTTAIFWRYGENLKAKFEHEQTRRFIKRSLEPDKGIRTDWTNPTSSDLKVRLFLVPTPQVNDPDLSKLKEILREFRQKLRNEQGLTAAGENRFIVYFANHPSEEFADACRQLADAFVFVSSKAFFGALASGANTLMDVILAAGDGEISKQPWNWCSQIIQIEDKSLIKTEWLAPRKVTITVPAGLEADTKTFWNIVDAT